MWFGAYNMRIQALLIVGFSLWIEALADSRILLEPEYSLHQRPPTDEGQALLIQVACSNFFYIYPFYLCLFCYCFSGEHQPTEYPGSEGEGAVGQP